MKFYLLEYDNKHIDVKEQKLVNDKIRAIHIDEFDYYYNLVPCWDEVYDYAKSGFVIMSACNKGQSTKDMIKATKELGAALKAEGVPYYTKIEGNPTFNKETVENISFVIPFDQEKWKEEEFLKFVLLLCALYKQESIIISDSKGVIERIYVQNFKKESLTKEYIESHYYGKRFPFKSKFAAVVLFNSGEIIDKKSVVMAS